MTTFLIILITIVYISIGTSFVYCAVRWLGCSTDVSSIVTLFWPILVVLLLINLGFLFILDKASEARDEDELKKERLEEDEEE